MPDVALLSANEARNIGMDLLQLADELLAEVRFQSSVGGISWFIAAVAAVTGAAFPDAAVAIAFGSSALAAVPIFGAWQQLRRQQVLDNVLTEVRKLGWALHSR